MSTLESRSRESLTPLIILALILGVLAGVVFGSQLAPLGAVGTVFIQMIKAVALPLVFLTIIEAIVSTSIGWRSAGRLLIVVSINTTCALALGLFLSNAFEPGRGLILAPHTGTAAPPPPPPQFSIMAVMQSVVPTSILQPFIENNVIAVVFLALLVGFATRTHLTGGRAEFEVIQAERLVRAAIAVWSTVMAWLVRCTPIAIFCVTAKTIGEYGVEPFRGLVWYVLLIGLGLLLQIVVVYGFWIRIIAGRSLRAFYAVAKKPIIYAIGTNSSLATVPLTLEALDSLKLPKEASRLGACVGTNLNNDGIILYEAMAVLFVAQAYGIDLSVGQQISVALISLVAAIGVAGVPEAGIVSLSLVLSAVELPREILPVLLTVDWMVARMRSVTNVLSDMTVSVGITALTKN